MTTREYSNPSELDTLAPMAVFNFNSISATIKLVSELAFPADDQGMVHARKDQAGTPFVSPDGEIGIRTRLKIWGVMTPMWVRVPLRGSNPGFLYPIHAPNHLPQAIEVTPKYQLTDWEFHRKSIRVETKLKAATRAASEFSISGHK